MHPWILRPRARSTLQHPPGAPSPLPSRPRSHHPHLRARNDVEPSHEAERRNLRDWYYVEKKEIPTQKAIKSWFYSKYFHHLSQSTISEILSDTFAYLDAVKRPSTTLTRNRQGVWPDLDAALSEWQNRVNRIGATVTGDILMEKARDLFGKLPQYAGVEMPKFSEGWLDGFKTRYKIRRYRRFGEAAAVDKVAVEGELVQLREKLNQYEKRDTYNMDESAIFWKMLPDATLADQQMPGGKIEKARLTVNFCTNVDGSHKLPPWFIGKAQNPRCFGKAGIKIDNFRCVWRFNTKAWMTGKLFKEYLRWFDRQVAPRKVVLVIDGFSAHHTGLDLLEEHELHELHHTTVLFLPANATSICQPLDQGIIKAWKSHFRRRWLSYVINEYEEGADPFKTMNVLRALRWSIEPWEQDVTKITIYNCWKKSRLLVGRTGTGLQHREDHSGWTDFIAEDHEKQLNAERAIAKSITVLKNQGRVKKAMDINSFLCPVEEVVQDSSEDILDQVAHAYATGPGAERTHETDEEDDEIPPIKEKSALQALRHLRLYWEQQNGGDEVAMSHLDRQERDIIAKGMNTGRQSTITAFFGSTSS